MQALRAAPTAPASASRAHSRARLAPARRAPLRVFAQTAAPAAPTTVTVPQQAISLSEKALGHLKDLRAKHASGGNESLLFRVGVKQGGCSGLSYLMDFEQQGNVASDDHVMEYDSGSFRLVVDPKSLLYLFGMRLDYSDALIGGGFQFQNPNATDSCGCGKSFGV